MDISLSGAEVALIATLLGGVTAPLTMMFRMLVADKDRQIARLEQQNSELLEVALTGTRAVESATTALSKTRGTR